MNPKIKCLRRFAELLGNHNGILIFLKKHDLLNDDDQKEYVKAAEKSSNLYLLLKRLQEEKKIIMLFFEWQVLPEEYINITITVPNEHFVISTRD